jgi:hypothetical protein
MCPTIDSRIKPPNAGFESECFRLDMKSRQLINWVMLCTPNFGLHPSDVLDVHHRSEKERKGHGICTKFILHPTLTISRLARHGFMIPRPLQLLPGTQLESVESLNISEGECYSVRGALVIKRGNTAQAALTGREEKFSLLDFWDSGKVLDSKRKTDKRKSEWQTQICWHEPVDANE